ncbi:MAG TPA: hypothetical protein VK541_05175 [Pedobacter sp.]|uniref:DUF7849 domain-containing protein n=1 Tax=Pedobacter sp. TaxID=1411316 RepID=UPI002BEFE635|nr:hypothetical protein [Pedobacter sp.]HMI01852.1 hypothetical protein [Pedobacter sp.]
MKTRLRIWLPIVTGAALLLTAIQPAVAQHKAKRTQGEAEKTKGLQAAKPLPLQTLPEDTVPAIINYKEENGVVKFSSVLRPLRPIAGAPEPFYTYFWEFGDGSFSFDKEPEHVFPDSLLRNVRLFATNSYDDGKRPPTRPKPLKPGSSRPVLASSASGVSGTSGADSAFFKSGGSIEMRSNCMPKPGEDMMLIFGYKNKRENGLASLGGTLTILYNDREFNRDNFELTETRVYHKEQKSRFDKTGAVSILKPGSAPDVFYGFVPGPNDLHGLSGMIDGGVNVAVLDPEGIALIKEKMAAFKTGESWKFDNLKAGEERFLFMQFKTTPDMIKDTNAVVRLTGLFTPSDPLVPAETFTMELQIVASHDPNKMMMKNSRMNFRLTGKKRKLTYKVRFQNTGKGPAKKVDVGVAIAEVLDMASIEILDSKPKLMMSDSSGYASQSSLDTIRTADSVHFVFKNIYLPGMQQKGVKDADSTMGFIEYNIGFKERPKKLPFKSGAAIVFDKNDPIYTNRSVGKYKMGLSPGVIAGYGFPFENGNSPFSGQKNISFGASIAPYAPHRYFLQAELYMSSYAEKEYLIKRTPGDGRIVAIENANGKREEARVNYIDSSAVIKVVTINVVPLQLRRNFNKYFGAGVGTLVSFNLDKQALPSRTGVLEFIQSPGTTTTISKTYDKIKSSFNDFQNTLFADVQLGKVHVGPSIGFRYLFTLQNTSNRMVTYLTWKF